MQNKEQHFNFSQTQQERGVTTFLNGEVLMPESTNPNPNLLARLLDRIASGPNRTYGVEANTSTDQNQ